MSAPAENSLYNSFTAQLISLRQQGMHISDINPVSALADMMSDQLYHGQLTRTEIEALISEISQHVWQKQATELAGKTNLSDFDPTYQAVRGALPRGLYRPSGFCLTKGTVRRAMRSSPHRWFR